MSAMLRLCFFFLIPYVLCETTQLLQTCTSCGPECEASCGSRNFRTCCYNYLKKRSPIPPLPPQDATLRSRYLWLSTLLDGASSPQSSGVNSAGSDRDVQVQLLLSPDWLSPDSLSHLNANYQENQILGRLVELSAIQPTAAPVVNGSSDNADTSVESSSGETNQGAGTHDTGHAENQRHHPPPHWNSRHQRQHSNYPWSEVNRRLPMYGA